MSPLISNSFQVTWSDLDANRHMRNTAYFDYAAQCRFLFFAGNGFGPNEFETHSIGPVILTETMTYKKELNFLEKFEVCLFCGGINESGTKFQTVDRFVSGDGRSHGELKTTFMWFDLRTRKTTRAPDALMELLMSIPKIDDFKTII